MSLSTECRAASLVAFYQSRNCGTGAGGFQKGNTCAGAAISEAVKGAAKGAAKGAVTGLLTGGPAFAKPGAAVGAAAGAVKGLYDNQMRPTRVNRLIDRLGSSEEKVSGLIKQLGGTNKSTAEAKGRTLRITVRDSSNRKTFTVEMNQSRITVYPRRATGRLTDKEVERVKQIARESSPKEVSVAVKKSSASYVGKLLRNGFKAAAGEVADVILLSYAVPAGEVAVANATHAIKNLKKRK